MKDQCWLYHELAERNWDALMIGIKITRGGQRNWTKSSVSVGATHSGGFQRALVCSEAGGTPGEGRCPEARWDLPMGAHTAQNQALISFLHRQAPRTWQIIEKSVCYRVVWWKGCDCHPNISSLLSGCCHAWQGCRHRQSCRNMWVAQVFKSDTWRWGGWGPKSLSPPCLLLRKQKWLKMIYALRESWLIWFYR